jgi:hypothetical protein
MPPRVNETTTYTIVWEVKNYYNDVKNAKVKAFLSPQVKLSGRISPENSRLTFDSQSHEIVWEIGDLEAGQGIFSQGPRLTFQIEFKPETEQRGQIAQLINEAKITAEDSWTEREIQALASAITTTLVDDPSISQEQGIIQ